MTIKFKVNKVEVNKTRLDAAEVDVVIQHRCGGTRPEACSTFTRKSVKEMPKYTRPIGIDNGLVSAVHTSWSNHYPLVLSPDMIWLCIAQGLAQHINENTDKLRSKFVEHEGKKDLTVVRDDFVKGYSKNAWPEVFDDFSEQIRRHVGDKTHDLLTPTFSTTGPVEKAAAQVVLMDCFKQYFSYGVVYICGIPEITLEGTVDDWRKLREKVLLLAEYDLEWWIKALEPVLDQFVAASSGSVDQDFWCRIYHMHGGKGAYAPGPFVTGWILTLFPYENRKSKSRNPYLTLWQEKDPASHAAEEPEHVNPWGSGDNIDTRGFTHYQFPPGVSSTPFTWTNATDPDKKYPMYFYAGFMTISQDPTTMAIRPEIGWAVADDTSLQDAKTKSERRGFW